MIEFAKNIGLDLLVVLGSGLVLVGLYRLANALILALPLRRATRAIVVRSRPVVAAALVLIWAIIAFRWVARASIGASSLTLVIVIGVAVAAAWRIIRDIAEGIYFRASGTCLTGDHVQIDAIRGRIKVLGLRAMTIETSDGELAILPYTQVTASSLFRSPAADRTSFHVFRVPMPQGASLPEAKQRVREAALLCHWSSIAQPPRCVATGDGDLEITVFALDADRASEIERAVRTVCDR